MKCRATLPYWWFTLPSYQFIWPSGTISLKLRFWWPLSSLQFFVEFLSLSSPLIPSLRCLRCDRSTDPSWASSSHTLRSSASRFKINRLLFPFKSSSSCLHFLPHLLVSYILSSNLPSILCFRQFLRNMLPNQLYFFRFTACRIFVSSFTLRNTLFFTLSVQLIFSIPPQQHIPQPKSRPIFYLFTEVMGYNIKTIHSNFRSDFPQFTVHQLDIL